MAGEQTHRHARSQHVHEAMSAGARRDNDLVLPVEDEIIERSVSDAPAEIYEKRIAARLRTDGNHDPSAEVGCPAVSRCVEARRVIIGVAAVHECSAQTDVRINAFVPERPGSPRLAEATFESYVAGRRAVIMVRALKPAADRPERRDSAANLNFEAPAGVDV